MNALLIGGAGSLINNLIIKLRKEGYRVYLLTGSRYTGTKYQKVFEKYNFTYDCSSLTEIFKSINPDLIIYMGAFDTNYRWLEEENDAVRYSAGLMNILMGYSMQMRGRFVYLSSDEVYSGNYEENIQESELLTPLSVRGMVLAQAEEMCDNYRRSRSLDIITLRLDHYYNIPESRESVRDICSTMCLEALEKNRITICPGRCFSLLYESDAVEFIYRVSSCEKHQEYLYNLSSQEELTQRKLADMINSYMGGNVEIVEEDTLKERRILSRNLFESEFGVSFLCKVPVIVKKIVLQMKNHSRKYLNGEEDKVPLWRRIFRKFEWLFKALFPYMENMAVFIPFFMLNNRAVGSAYFDRLDFYLLYVLLFAIVYGQQQALFSAVLAMLGYFFRQMYNRSGYEVLLDTTTYVWVAQLFILGLTVGYMRDQIKQLKKESAEEQDFLTLQLSDIQDINGSNVRVKDALETEIVNQSDSVGKIYNITSALNQYSPEEVLFYAAEMLGRLMKTGDVAIYTVSNASYARLFSFTSSKAKMLGNSIRYTEMGELYEELIKQKVFINRKLDERYPLMANAIYEEDAIQMIIMIWGIPWESMTLGQANNLVVISSLIQNAVLRAGRYMDSLEKQRYVEDTRMLGQEAFSALARAYLQAKEKNLTECALLKIKAEPEMYKSAGKILSGRLRQTDYMGILEDGYLYALLANTNEEDARFVIERFAEMGFESCIVSREIYHVTA